MPGLVFLLAMYKSVRSFLLHLFCLRLLLTNGKKVYDALLFITFSGDEIARQSSSHGWIKRVLADLIHHCNFPDAKNDYDTALFMVILCVYFWFCCHQLISHVHQLLKYTRSNIISLVTSTYCSVVLI